MAVRATLLTVWWRFRWLCITFTVPFSVSMWLLFIYTCVRGERVCVYSRVSLGNEDDYAALGGGEERQQPRGGRGEENMCL